MNRQCLFIKANGKQCQAPAVDGLATCLFHTSPEVFLTPEWDLRRQQKLLKKLLAECKHIKDPNKKVSQTLEVLAKLDALEMRLKGPEPPSGQERRLTSAENIALIDASPEGIANVRRTKSWRDTLGKKELK
jgi:hypothetical protein